MPTAARWTPRSFSSSNANRFACARRPGAAPFSARRRILPANDADCSCPCTRIGTWFRPKSGTIVGAASHHARALRREEVRAFVLSGDHSRGVRASRWNPAPLALGLAVTGRESVSRTAEGRAPSGTYSDLRGGIGTPKSLIQKLANPIGRDPDQVALLFSLSRAIGLWDASATNTAAPPGSFTLNELTEVLFATWRRGGAWDEARLEPEVMRVASDSRRIRAPRVCSARS